MANSSDKYPYPGDYTVLWVHPRMPKEKTWSSSHDFDLCFREIIHNMVKRHDIDVYDFNLVIHEIDIKVTTGTVITKIKQIQPHLIMFFDEFSQWNLGALHAIKRDKEILKMSYQILSYPTLSLVLSNN